MQRVRVSVILAAVGGMVIPAAAGLNRVYLVPALQECPGPVNCPRALESTHTFDSIVLRSPGSKYAPAGKPAFTIDFRGVRDAGGTLVNGTVTVRVRSGRVSLPGFGTFPDDSPLTVVAPETVTLKNGNGKLSYTPVASPSGLLTNGGGVEVLDPTGKLLAVTGTQSKP